MAGADESASDALRGSVSAELRTRFRAHLEDRPALLPAGSTVVVALSGGPDSVCLLHLLCSLRSERRFRLCAAHFDHGLRAGSDAEAKRVVGWASEAGVPCEIGRPDTPPAPTQAALREVRYAFLIDVCERVGAARLALAHQADDQAETVLFRILRGTDLRGLAGIPERRGRIVRPLLPFRKAEILRELHESGVPYLVDPSNSDIRWARNWVRHVLLPELEESRDDLRARLFALAAAAAKADRLLEEAAARVERRARAAPACRAEDAEGESLRRDVLLRCPPELRARVLRQAARRLGVQLGRGGTRSGVEFMSRGRSGGHVDVGGGMELAREYDWLRLRRRLRGPDAELEIPGPGRGAGTVTLGGRTRRLRWYPGSADPNGRTRIAVPVRAGHYPVTVRGWRPGDRVCLAAGTRKLKKVFADRRVPRSERGRFPLVVDRRGRVWGVPDLALPAWNEEIGAPVLVIEFEDA